MGSTSAASVRVYSSIEELGDRPKFHAITLFEVLEHLDEPAAILSQLSRMIADGGILILETPDCSGITDIKTHEQYRKVHPLEHINAFTNSTLKSIASRSGFTVIPKGAAHATTEISRVAKREARHLLGKGDASTQLYFRKTALLHVDSVPLSFF